MSAEYNIIVFMLPSSHFLHWLKIICNHLEINVQTFTVIVKFLTPLWFAGDLSPFSTSNIIFDAEMVLKSFNTNSYSSFPERNKEKCHNYISSFSTF